LVIWPKNKDCCLTHSETVYVSVVAAIALLIPISRDITRWRQPGYACGGLLQHVQYDGCITRTIVYDVSHKIFIYYKVDNKIIIIKLL